MPIYQESSGARTKDKHSRSMLALRCLLYWGIKGRHRRKVLLVYDRPEFC